jgi:hypothetical protein
MWLQERFCKLTLKHGFFSFSLNEKGITTNCESTKSIPWPIPLFFLELQFPFYNSDLNLQNWYGMYYNISVFSVPSLGISLLKILQRVTRDEVGKEVWIKSCM